MGWEWPFNGHIDLNCLANVHTIQGCLIKATRHDLLSSCLSVQTLCPPGYLQASFDGSEGGQPSLARHGPCTTTMQHCRNRKKANAKLDGTPSGYAFVDLAFIPGDLSDSPEVNLCRAEDHSFTHTAWDLI